MVRLMSPPALMCRLPRHSGGHSYLCPRHPCRPGLNYLPVEAFLGVFRGFRRRLQFNDCSSGVSMRRPLCPYGCLNIDGWTCNSQERYESLTSQKARRCPGSDTAPQRTFPAAGTKSAPARNFIIRNYLVVPKIRMALVGSGYAENAHDAFPKIC